MIDDSRLWGSRRCRRMGEYSTETKLFTWMVHTLDNHNASLSEGVPPRRCGWGLSRNASSDAGQHGFPASDATKRSEAAPRASPPSPGAAARRTVGVLVVGATPLFWPLMRHGAGAGYSCLYSSFSPASGGRSHHRDPCGKAAEAARNPTRRTAATNGPQAKKAKTPHVWLRIRNDILKRFENSAGSMLGAGVYNWDRLRLWKEYAAKFLVK